MLDNISIQNIGKFGLKKASWYGTMISNLSKFPLRFPFHIIYSTVCEMHTLVGVADEVYQILS
jgi:hypothetical protein